MPEVTLTVNRAYEFLKTYDHRWEVVGGGAGSGKSYAFGQFSIIGALENPRRRYVHIRKVARTLRLSTYALLRDIINESGLRPYFRVNQTEMSFQCSSGGSIYTSGLDDVDKMKSIVGVTDIIFDEATEATDRDLTQLNLRMRGGDLKKRIVLGFNPILNTHFLKRRFYDTPQPNVGLHMTTYKDNAFLDAEYVAELEALKESDPLAYQVYALGQWGELGNGVFTNFVIEDFDHDESTLEHVFQGMDFGFNHASAIVRAGFRDGELYVFDELYAKGLTNSEFIEHAKQFVPDHRRLRLRADPAEPDRILEFYNNGFKMIEPAKKGKDSVRAGIDYLKSFRIHIHRTRCPHAAQEVQNYQWRMDKQGNRVDEFVAFNDDCIAALRYGCEELRFAVLPLSERLRQQMMARRAARRVGEAVVPATAVPAAIRQQMAARRRASYAREVRVAA